MPKKPGLKTHDRKKPSKMYKRIGRQITFRTKRLEENCIDKNNFLGQTVIKLQKLLNINNLSRTGLFWHYFDSNVLYNFFIINKPLLVKYLAKFVVSHSGDYRIIVRSYNYVPYFYDNHFIHALRHSCGNGPIRSHWHHYREKIFLLKSDNLVPWHILGKLGPKRFLSAFPRLSSLPRGKKYFFNSTSHRRCPTLFAICLPQLK